LERTLTISLVTVAELAREIGISRQWLNKLVDRGKIPAVKRGKNGRLIIRSGEELSDWLKRRRTWEYFGARRRPRLNPLEREIRSYGRTCQLIDTLLGLNRAKAEFPLIHNASWDLPIRDGLKALHGDPEFNQFMNYPVFKWFCAARTEKARAMREDIFQHSYSPGEYRSMADIARKHHVTRAAVSKAYLQMKALEKVPSNSRGNRRKAAKAEPLHASSWQIGRKQLKPPV
jgi:excisionase family DNA binding protein